jgi:4-amino-4-deoxy-L-arabinose transferase-like glycosyltransferase
VLSSTCLPITIDVNESCRPASSVPSSTWRILVALVAAIASLAAVSTWQVYGHTWDEPEHLAAGLELIDRGRCEYDVQHPPLGRVLIAIGPYLAGACSLGSPPPDGAPEGVRILYGGGGYNWYLTLARLGTLPFISVLVVAAWLWAQRVAGSKPEALLAIILLAATPPIIGHGALATLDLPAAATTLLALYALQVWVLDGRWRNAAALGVTAGLAVVTKLSAIPFLGVGRLVLTAGQWGLSAEAARRTGRPRPPDPVGWRQRVWELCVVATMAAVAVAIAYGGHFVTAAEAVGRLGGGDPSITIGWLRHIWVPEGLEKLWEAVRAVEWHNETGHFSFLLGDVRTRGWWYFYLVALAAKTPLPLLATGPLGLALLVHDGWREFNPWKLAPATLFVGMLVFASIVSHINIGVRHVLILYPCLALGAAHSVARAWRWLRTVQDRDWAGVGSAAIAGLVAWQVGTLRTANPDYLPYFNEAVRHPERVLVDSDLAWGQDVRRLERRLSELKVPRFAFAYLGTADLTRETFPRLTRLAPGQPTTGWIAITELARVHSLRGYAWLDAYVPLERIGKSISLHYVPEAADSARSR